MGSQLFAGPPDEPELSFPRSSPGQQVLSHLPALPFSPEHASKSLPETPGWPSARPLPPASTLAPPHLLSAGLCWTYSSPPSREAPVLASCPTGRETLWYP